MEAATGLENTVKSRTSEVRELQWFKEKATKLLTALISSCSATDLHTTAIELGDPKAYYEALLKLPDPSGYEDPSAHQLGVGVPSALSNSGANHLGVSDAMAAEKAASSKVFLVSGHFYQLARMLTKV